jgi:hypothetical protein
LKTRLKPEESGRFFQDYLRNLTCWEKSKNSSGLSAPKLSDKDLFLVRNLLGSVTFDEKNVFIVDLAAILNFWAEQDLF